MPGFVEQGKERGLPQFFITPSQPHNEILRMVLDETWPIIRPCPITLLPLKKKKKSAQLYEPNSLCNIEKSISALEEEKTQERTSRKTKLLWLLSLSPSLPLHKLNLLHWLHICISAGSCNLFSDSTPWFPPWMVQGWQSWPRRDQPLSAVLEEASDLN